MGRTRCHEGMGASAMHLREVTFGVVVIATIVGGCRKWWTAGSKLNTSTAKPPPQPAHDGRLTKVSSVVVAVGIILVGIIFAGLPAWRLQESVSSASDNTPPKNPDKTPLYLPFGCNDVEKCPVKLVVNWVVPADCHDAALVGSPKTKFLRVGITVDTPDDPSKVYPRDNSPLRLHHWAVKDANGRLGEIQLATECGENQYVILQKSVMPGLTVESDLYFLAPYQATDLVLINDAGTDSRSWSIRRV